MFSKRLQKVEQFPWEILKTQDELVKMLKKRAQIKLENDDTEVTENILDEKLWPNLGTNLENILNGTYKGLKTTVFEMFRRGRSADDIRSSSLRLLTTV